MHSEKCATQCAKDWRRNKNFPLVGRGKTASSFSISRGAHFQGICKLSARMEFSNLSSVALFAGDGGADNFLIRFICTYNEVKTKCTNAIARADHNTERKSNFPHERWQSHKLSLFSLSLCSCLSLSPMVKTDIVKQFGLRAHWLNACVCYAFACLWFPLEFNWVSRKLPMNNVPTGCFEFA